MIATHKMQGRARIYPCPRCHGEHYSNTTVLNVIGSEQLMGWNGRVGTKKVKMFSSHLQKISPEIFKKCSELSEAEWNAENEKDGKSPSGFWQSSYEIMKETADIGTVTHAAIEMFLNGKSVDKKSLSKPSLLAFEAFERFFKENELITNATEKTSYNCLMNYAGTSDWDGMLNGKLTKGEWKTSSGIFEKSVIQVWGNVISDEMYDGSRLYEQILVGQFGKDGSFNKLIIPRRGLEDGYGSYEQARVLIAACVPWFHYKQEWERRFPYIPKNKTGAKQ